MTGFENLTLSELSLLQDLAQSDSLRSLSRARRLQPSHVSKILKRMEKKLGIPLAVRSAKGATLTPEGIRIAGVAHEILLKADALTQPKPAARTLSIAGPRFLCSSLVPRAMVPIKERFPEYRFRVLDMAPDQVQEAAFASACDVILTIGTPALSRAWEIERIGDLEWGLFVHSAHPLRSTAKEDEVLRHPFLVPNYWTGEKFEPGNDYCPVDWKHRLKGDETSAISVAIEILSRCKSQMVFAPSLVMREPVDNGIAREIKVKSWKTVKKPVYAAVRSDGITATFWRVLLGELGRAIRH